MPKTTAALPAAEVAAGKAARDDLVPAATWPSVAELGNARKEVANAHDALDGLYLSMPYYDEVDEADEATPEQLGVLTEFLSGVSADLESMQDYVRRLSRVRDAVTFTGR